MDEQSEIKIEDKQLFVELVRKHHNFLYTKRKYKDNDDIQVYFFKKTQRLVQDLTQLASEQHD